MIPRGLAVAVCIGIAAGAAAGLVLYGKGGAGSAGMPLSYVEGPSLSIAVEKAHYEAGEAVRVRVVNTGTVPLVFADGSYGLRVTQLDGIEVYSPPRLHGAAGGGEGAPVLGPREEAAVVWNQTRSAGGPVLHGTYKILSGATPAHGAAAAAAASVTINILG